MSFNSQITTPTLVTTSAGREGVVVYDNPNVTNNNNASAYVIFADTTFGQFARATLTQVPGSLTGPSAFPPGLGPGQ